MTDFFADDAAYQAALQVAQGDQQSPLFEPTFEPAQEPAQSEPAPQEPVEESIPEFDSRYREPFSGLLYVGALTKEFSYFGHTFTIATPSQTELLQVGQVIQEYAQTATGQLAYTTAMVAAYLIKIDGQPLPQPIFNEGKDTALQDRFNWVIKNLRRPVIEEVFNQTLELDSEVANVLEAMGKASG